MPLSRIKRRLHLPLPMRGIERPVYVAVILSLIFGIALSFALRDWQYFERAGSLVILVGVLLTWRDLAGLLGEVEKIYEHELSTMQRSLDARKSTSLYEQAHQNRERTEAIDPQSQIVEVVALMRLRLRTTEAAILSIGTVVWGYGAPICGYLWPFR